MPWLNLIGLVLDFAGFCLLLREWWIGFFSEAQQLALSDDLARARRLREFAGTHAKELQKKHLETSGRMMDEMAVSRAREAQLAARGSRKGVFVVASTLIVTGFTLQIAAAWPS